MTQEGPDVAFDASSYVESGFSSVGSTLGASIILG